MDKPLTADEFADLVAHTARVMPSCGRCGLKFFCRCTYHELRQHALERLQKAAGHHYAIPVDQQCNFCGMPSCDCQQRIDDGRLVQVKLVRKTEIAVIDEFENIDRTEEKYDTDWSKLPNIYRTGTWWTKRPAQVDDVQPDIVIGE